MYRLSLLTVLALAPAVGADGPAADPRAVEHFEKPLDDLRELVPKLAKDGMVVIEVPDAGATPFDLLVADHASHFTRADLERLASGAGLVPLALANDWMVKELSLVAVQGNSDMAVAPATASAARDSLARYVAWLDAVLNQARNAAQGATSFGIFGTSIAAMWLYGETERAVEFFVDEDPSRIGTLHDRPVLTPNRIPNGATVYLALIPDVATAVAARIGRADIGLELPPAFRRN